MSDTTRYREGVTTISTWEKVVFRNEKVLNREFISKTQKITQNDWKDSSHWYITSGNEFELEKAYQEHVHNQTPKNVMKVLKWVANEIGDSHKIDPTKLLEKYTAQTMKLGIGKKIRAKIPFCKIKIVHSCTVISMSPLTVTVDSRPHDKPIIITKSDII